MLRPGLPGTFIESPPRNATVVSPDVAARPTASGGASRPRYRCHPNTFAGCASCHRADGSVPGRRPGVDGRRRQSLLSAATVSDGGLRRWLDPPRSPWRNDPPALVPLARSRLSRRRRLGVSRLLLVRRSRRARTRSSCSAISWRSAIHAPVGRRGPSRPRALQGWWWRSTSAGPGRRLTFRRTCLRGPLW